MNLPQKHYSFFHPLWMSFYSKEIYQYVKHCWRGWGLLYVLTVMIICWSVVAIAWLSIMVPMLPTPEMFSGDKPTENPGQERMLSLIKQVPTITIKDGEASITEPGVQVIEDAISQTPILMIDTTGEKKELLQQDEVYVLLTKNRVYVKDFLFKHQVRSFPVREVLGADTVIDYAYIQENVLRLPAALKQFFLAACFAAFGLNIAKILLFAVIATIIIRLNNLDFSFNQTVRIIAVAATPVLVLSTIMAWVPGLMAYSVNDLILLIINIMYVFFGFWSNIKPPATEA